MSRATPGHPASIKYAAARKLLSSVDLWMPNFVDAANIYRTGPYIMKEWEVIRTPTPPAAGTF